MNISLEASLKLSQTLSPQMIQSLKLLQYSNLQLEQVIRKELQENPILEEMASEETAPVPETPVSKEEEIAQAKAKKDDIEWDDYYSQGHDFGFRRNAEDRVDEIYEKIPVQTTSLEEHLLTQLHEKELSEKDTEIGEFLIGNIDDRGYLVVPPAEIADKLGVDEKKVNEIRFIIQHFDPTGVASLNLRENLLTQLYTRGQGNTLMYTIVDKYFEPLKKYQIPEIAKQMGKSVTEIQDAVREIGKLDPHPGSLISATRPQVINPELVVTKTEDGEFHVNLNDANVPLVRVSKSYVHLLKGEKEKTPEIKKYISEKMNSANWLIRSIEQRKITMLKVMSAIVERQREWFEKGPPHLKPLILQEIADDIGMHISTVCRVTNDKYVQTPYGIYELKYFFGSGVDQGDGTEISTSQAKEMLREIVEGEDRQKPYSDQKLVELLKEQGIQVARRTVSKYREQLNILPARLRKQY